MERLAVAAGRGSTLVCRLADVWRELSGARCGVERLGVSPARSGNLRSEAGVAAARPARPSDRSRLAVPWVLLHFDVAVQVFLVYSYSCSMCSCR